jgi:hypothetical protein
MLFIRVDPRGFVVAHTEDAEQSQEIQKGKEIVEKFQKGETTCQNLTNEDFHSVGEYVMEQIVGGSDHLTMNKMIEEMHGREGEELMHINMGKRFLGCDGSGRAFFWMMGGPNMPDGMMHGFNYWRGWDYIIPFLGTIGSIYASIILMMPLVIFGILILVAIYLFKKIKKNGQRNREDE